MSGDQPRFIPALDIHPAREKLPQGNNGGSPQSAKGISAYAANSSNHKADLRLLLLSNPILNTTRELAGSRYGMVPDSKADL